MLKSIFTLISLGPTSVVLSLLKTFISLTWTNGNQNSNLSNIASWTSNKFSCVIFSNKSFLNPIPKFGWKNLSPSSVCNKFLILFFTASMVVSVEANQPSFSSPLRIGKSIPIFIRV